MKKRLCSHTFPQDFLDANAIAYEPIGLLCSHVIQEAESEEYGALIFKIQNKRIKFRIGKITPTKLGQ